MLLSERSVKPDWSIERPPRGPAGVVARPALASPRPLGAVPEPSGTQHAPPRSTLRIGHACDPKTRP